ncbi:DUF3800 domain-containing protein [Formosa algae]|uniref:DUF3800 domain-containing protein n=1 Tax=Formosa algae TaxID=225843 RepID=A0A9X0YHU6_9FLAO|nr:DUF3800 domain-containing protein [Formosa algae]MBP1838867.1 hypothetical protein [Formosa algae]MDQ0333644.1 hypothetical protein [Formosa algae]OEI78834.1 hypothetical protein AST99_16790 [Formosa algae]
MLKWYADNTELSTEKGKPNVLVFGGVIVDENSEKKIEKLLRDIKSKYTYPTLPLKWNFKDLKPTYKEFNRLKEYEALLKDSYEWRNEIFTRSLDIDYKVILACTQRYPSDKPLSKIKEQLTEICFSQSLMRVGMFAKHLPFKENFEIILDWPDGSNPKPFNREYFKAYNLGQSSSQINYLSGPLINLGFNDSLYYAKSTHSAVLQFADLVIGAAKDFMLKSIHNHDHSLGYNLTSIILPKYQGYPNKIIEYGMNFAPKSSECYTKINNEIKNNVA